MVVVVVVDVRVDAHLRSSATGGFQQPELTLDVGRALRWATKSVKIVTQW